jgi:Sortase and related acyltransferases
VSGLTPSAIKVRYAVLDDAPAILEIYQQHIPFDDINLLSAVHWIEQANSHRPMWVATIDGELIGWCSLESYYGLKVLDHMAELSLYIAKSWRRKGIGRQLMAEVMANALCINLTNLVVNVFSGNESSIRFFESLNFQRYGALPRVVKMPHHTEDIIVMGLEITG